jgi:Mrp family chromosome partitioning ATPase
VLVLDMPPGIHDTTLELASVAPAARHLVVATGSRIALSVAARLLRYLHEARMPVAGIVENMARASTAGGGAGVASLAADAGVPFLGALPFDPSLEAAIGDPGRLLATPFASALDSLIVRALGSGFEFRP